MTTTYDWYLHSKLTERWCFNEGLFTTDECKNIIHSCKELQVSDFAVVEKQGELIEDPIRKSKVLFLPSNDVKFSWIFQKITDCIVSLNDEFFNFDIEKIETLQFSEYDGEYNGHYGKHIDILYNNPLIRKLSFTVQLSDPDEYKGGDLLLHLSDHPSAGIKTQGTLNAFPSYILHEITPVTSGTRYSLVGWVTGPAFR